MTIKIMSDLKSCSKCGIHQAVSEFPKDAEKSDGHRAQCKTCVAASKRKSYLKTQYGIEEDWVDLTYDQQNGRCKHCGCTVPKSEMKIDHVHDTNPPILRGLLCNSCNLDLGIVEQNIKKYENLVREAKLYRHYTQGRIQRAVS